MSMFEPDRQLMPLEAMELAAECLRTLAHPHRLRIVEMLLAQPRSVNALAEACDISQPVCSDHLRKMKDRGLLFSERRGRFVFYAIEEHGLRSIMACVRNRFGGNHTVAADAASEGTA